jgi:hypothetical protein
MKLIVDNKKSNTYKIVFFVGFKKFSIIKSAPNLENIVFEFLLLFLVLFLNFNYFSN